MRWMTTAMILSLLLAGSNVLQAGGVEFADGSDEFRVVTADDSYEGDTKVVGAALECAAPQPACAAPAPVCAPAPSCCAPAPAPSCCAPAPKCCAPAPAPSCCAPAAPSCCAPAPSCCAPAPSCCEKKSCCSKGCCLTKLFHKKKQCNNCGCDQCQQQASNPTFFSKMMDIERRKNEWLVETFIDRF